MTSLSILVKSNGVINKADYQLENNTLLTGEGVH